MAHREQHGNKEKKKPKADKNKAKPQSTPPSPFADPRYQKSPPAGKK